MVSLGLVYDVCLDSGVLVVEMTMTTPGCPVSESLSAEARTAVRQAAGDSLPVDVRVVWDPPWEPSMMDDTAASALGFASCDRDRQAAGPPTARVILAGARESPPERCER